MLQRKMVLQFECGNIFAKMNNSAFIVEDKIHALYEEGKLYFQSYTVANQIFSLIDFVTEATNAEIESFGEIDGINVNTESIKHIANIIPALKDHASAYKVVIEYRQYFSFYEKSTSNKN